MIYLNIYISLTKCEGEYWEGGTLGECTDRAYKKDRLGGYSPSTARSSFVNKRFITRLKRTFQIFNRYNISSKKQQQQQQQQQQQKKTRQKTTTTTRETREE